MKRTRRILPFLGPAILLLLAAACAPAATPAPTPVPASPTPLSLPTTAAAPSDTPAAPPVVAGGTDLTGASLFQIACAACHGLDAAGKSFEMDDNKIDTPNIQLAELTPLYATDPTRGSFEAQFGLAVVQGQDEEGEELNAMMPRWTGLSEDQVNSLAAFIQAGAFPAGAAPTLTPEALNLQGEALYNAACAACHGADGAGLSFVMDDNQIDTPSIRLADLTRLYGTDPTRGSLEAQFSLAVVQGQDEKGGDLNAMMPRWTFLSQDQVNSLIQYIQSAFK